MEERQLPVIFKEFIQCLNSNNVEYLLVGGWAVAFHGHPRTTKDIDFLISNSSENIKKAKKALIDFGAPPINWKEFKKEGHLIRIGVSPILIDIINKADGIEIEDCYKRHIIIEADNIKITTISKEDLIKNKKASGRLIDLDDAAKIEKREIFDPDNLSDNIVKCLKYQLIDTNRYKTFEKMNLTLVSDYNSNIIKYSKTLKNKKQYYLCREINNGEIELFYMNKDFNKKQAYHFLNEWDKKYGNFNQTNIIKKNKK